MSGNIYVASGFDSVGNLQSFAKEIFGLLKVRAYSIRKSDNYPEGEYYLGSALGLRIEVALADDEQFSEYRFWVTLSSDGVWIEDQALFEVFADLLARYLVLGGYQVARDPNNGRIGGPKLVYSCKFGEAFGPGQIEVTKVDLD